MKLGGVFYNENDPYPAKWLENLSDVGLIAKGTVSTDDIRTIKPERLSAYQRCHFFAGIGVWEYALQQAGWPHGWEVWTGSCPCQPFSGAGKRKGCSDERHLWPVWFDLIRERRPGVILGEQVASPDGYAWFDHVQADMESLDYACGAVVTPAAGYGAPNERHRIYWMAHAHDARSQGRHERRDGTGECVANGLGDAEIGNGRLPDGQERQQMPEPSRAGEASGMDDSLRNGSYRASAAEAIQGGDRQEGRLQQRVSSDALGKPAAGPVNGFWQSADWLLCRDGKWRPVRPGTFPLAHGSAARVGRLRAYGNAIVAPQAIEFIKAVIDELRYLLMGKAVGHPGSGAA